MSRKRIVTVVVLVAVVGVIAAVVAFARSSSTQQMTVTAQFEDTVGLYEGNAVSVLGMRIGSVTSIKGKDNYVEVKLAIDKGVDIPADAKAVTLNTSLLTDRHVELTPAYKGGPKLRNGDVIGLARTRTPVEFDRTLKMVDKLSIALGGNGKGQGPLADFLSASEAVASGNGENVKSALDELSKALRVGQDNGAPTAKNLQSIVANVAQLTQAAAENDSAIREFGSNLRQVSDIIADEDIGTGTTGKKLNQVVDIASGLLEKNGDKLTTAISSAKGVTTALVDMRRELAESFNLIPLLADNIYNVVDPVAGVAHANLLLDKAIFQSQFTKEACNLINRKQLGCATGTAADFGPDFGLGMMLDLMAGKAPS